MIFFLLSLISASHAGGDLFVELTPEERRMMRNKYPDQNSHYMEAEEYKRWKASNSPPEASISRRHQLEADAYNRSVERMKREGVWDPYFRFMAKVHTLENGDAFTRAYNAAWLRGAQRSIQPARAGSRTTGEKLNPLIGSPYYILEQGGDRTGVREFKLWELRPGDAQIEADSRLIVQAQGIEVQAFGLSGFEIAPPPADISPGTPVFLDTQGRLFFSQLDPELHAKAKLEQIPGTYTALENEAEQSLMARRADGLWITIHPDGKASEQTRRGASRSNSLRRDQSGAFSPIQNAELPPEFAEIDPKSNQPSIEVVDAVRSTKGIWIIVRRPKLPLQLEFVNAERKVVQSADLSFHLQSASQDQETKILRTTDDEALLRVGERIFSYQVKGQGRTLSNEVLSRDFFGRPLINYGISFGVHQRIQALQPRLADRRVIRREGVVRGTVLKSRNLSPAEKAKELVDEYPKHARQEEVMDFFMAYRFRELEKMPADVYAESIREIISKNTPPAPQKAPDPTHSQPTIQPCIDGMKVDNDRKTTSDLFPVKKYRGP